MEYKNRKGDTYYLHQGETKTGKLRYYFSREQSAVSVDIPDGYEIYENPNAQVFLRKKLPKVITESELAIVSQGVREYAQRFKVEIKKNTIVVFQPNQSLTGFEEILSRIPLLNLFEYQKKEAMEIFDRSTTYSPIMRFVLVDEETREFRVERWCFRGSIDDWICLAVSQDLSRLVKQYCQHLGKDSFYDLF
ncbi:MAG: hypothetical protein HUU50_05825 [Candidatus Brocadiae bacterium]|nr:hypothetical protein [Candidatus Brocadiia bacterium]